LVEDFFGGNQILKVAS